MIADTKEMKGLMLVEVHTLLQSWWSMEGRHKRKKKIQFVAIFHLLKHGGPMTNFEHMKVMFDFFKIHHTPKKQLTSWGMDVAMHNVILKQLMLLVQ
jgi:hypothetical protein